MTEQAVPSPASPELPSPTPSVARRRWLDLVTAGVLVLGAGLTIASTFGDYRQVQLSHVADGRNPDGQVTIAFGAWGARYAGNVVVYGGPALRLGIPLVVGAVLVILGAVLMVAVRDGGRLAVLRPLTVGAAGVVIGTIWTVDLYVSHTYDLPTANSQATSGPGWFLLFAAVAVMLLGFILALVSAWYRSAGGRSGNAGDNDRTDTPAGPAVYAIEPDTPRYGIPILGEMPPREDKP